MHNLRHGERVQIRLCRLITADAISLTPDSLSVSLHYGAVSLALLRKTRWQTEKIQISFLPCLLTRM